MKNGSALRGQSLSKSLKDAFTAAPETIGTDDLSYQRKTYKFWVQQGHETKVIESISQALSAKEGNRERGDGIIHPTTTRGGHNQSGHCKLFVEHVSSIYFDAPDGTLYKLLVENNGTTSENRILFRVRYYQEQPQIAVLELKTYSCKKENKTDHPESVKERVVLRRCDLAAWLSEILPTPTLANLPSVAWGPMEADRALKTVDCSLIQATKKKRDKNLAHATLVFLRMQDIIQSMHLRPCIYTNYSRLAMQPNCLPQIRITLDRDIILAPYVNQRLRDKNMYGQCLLDECHQHQLSCYPCLPFSILEIKIKCNQDKNECMSIPSQLLFVKELLQRGLIQECVKFSKFMTGVAAFMQCAAKNHTPPWMNDPMFTSFVNDTKQISKL